MMSTGTSLAEVSLGEKICLKEFLSDSMGESGAVVWFLEVPEKGKFYDAEVQIKDCSRSVTLDFSFDDDKGLRKRINKINLLIECLNLFKQRLEKCERLLTVTSKRKSHGDLFD